MNDPDLVSIAEQVGNPQLRDLADAQAGGIRGYQQGAVFAIEIRTPKELLQLLHAVHLGAQDGFLHSRQGLLDGFSWAVEYLPKEKPQSTDCNDDGTEGQLLDPQQVQEVGLDLVVHDLIGRAVIEPG